MPDREEINASWRHILGELGDDVARLRSGRLDRLASADWSPPTIVGPLPDEYAHAARDLIDQQRAVIEALEDARRKKAEHLAAVRAAEPARGHQPAYLDVEG